MARKCILILADGMRPDALDACGHPYYRQFLKDGGVQLAARSVMPSVTLPCHLSLFHSVPPQRHGTLTNTYAPPVRPVRGLFNVLKSTDHTTALFYNWEELRDIAQPGSLTYSCFMEMYTHKDSDARLTDAMLDYIAAESPDFVFLYLGAPDNAGHHGGWMGEEYLTAVHMVWSCIEKVVGTVGADYDVIVTADHGGHERGHGTDMEEDMNIPLLLRLTQPAALREGPVSLLDIAPTVCALLGVRPDRDWEGESLL